MRALRHRSLRHDGFTLIELMVALSVGLFFSVIVFMLSRDVSRFFQRESRVADATMGAIIGFERLKADLARAGYLASPLLLKDPRRCPRPPAPLAGGGWANFGPLSEMGALYVTRGTAGANLSANGQALLALNGLTPDRIRMYGNYQTAEQFPVQAISGAGATVTIQLDANSGALVRLGYNPATPNPAILTEAFPANRALRLVTPDGDEQYSIIVSALPDPLGVPIVTVNHAALSLRYRDTEATCGIRGVGTGTLVNTVNIIEYELDDTFVRTDPTYADLNLGSAGEVWPRTDLVRFEVDPQTGAPLAGTREVVAEYAVDLRVGVTAVVTPLTGATTTFPAGDAGMDPYTTQANALLLNNGPQFLRAVRAQLSVRARAPDRGADIPAAMKTNPTDLYRVALPGGGDTFARARTLAATIALRNTRGVRWP